MSQVDLQQATELYFARIHRAALVLSGNPWDADDLAQETFLEFARQADRFEGRSSLYTWLYGILLNLDRKQRRRFHLWRRKLSALCERLAHAEASSPPAGSRLETAEWRKSLWSQVAQLPDAQRHTLVLRFSERLTYEQIAEVMGCPIGTVRSRLHHGLATLRVQLGTAASQDVIEVPDHVWEDLNHAV